MREIAKFQDQRTQTQELKIDVGCGNSDQGDTDDSLSGFTDESYGGIKDAESQSSYLPNKTSDKMPEVSAQL